uniref:Phytanoyl-CoA dioxygenase n=1 Tax=Haptolina brevifila TaxID=156173 RepID=A0A7S2BEV1_9EUKA
MSDTERAAAATTLHLPAGSAVAFDYRLWHRGMKNTERADRPVLYAIVGRPVWRDGHLKGLPMLDRGGETSLLTGEAVPPAPSFQVGAMIVPEEAAQPAADNAECEQGTSRPKTSRAAKVEADAQQPHHRGLRKRSR